MAVNNDECCNIRRRNPRNHSIIPQIFARIHPHQTQYWQAHLRFTPGTNYGENLGSNLTISGTMGAALQAACSGIPGVAVPLQTQVGDHFILWARLAGRRAFFARTSSMARRGM